MLRIILIGNGFDLAHGFKTGYSDFIEWYWNRKYNEVLSKCESSKIEEAKDILETDGIKLIQDSLQYECEEFYVPLCKFKNVEDLLKHVNYKNHLLEVIQNDMENPNWCGIEANYRECLENSTDVFKDNNDLYSVRLRLIEYLNGVNEFIANVKYREGYQNKILDVICADDEKVDKYILLSLNYTQTADDYKRLLENKKKNVLCIYLHGKIQEPNTILFGDGKDISLKGSLAVERDNTAFDDNSKRKYYQESTQMKPFENEISENEYEVFVMGHSCGGSDNCLMNKIFNNAQCKRIRIVHNGEDDYNEKIVALNKISSVCPVEKYSESTSMPQNDLIAVDDMEFVLVKGDKNRSVNDFWISKYLVTRNIYNKYCDSSYARERNNLIGFSISDANKFVKIISEKLFINFRIPTEIEWRYAAKGGKRNDKYVYSGSDNIDEVALYKENFVIDDCDVGNKKPNSLGVYDMSGYMEELCRCGNGDYIALGGNLSSDKEECMIDSAGKIINNDSVAGLRLVF